MQETSRNPRNHGGFPSSYYDEFEFVREMDYCLSSKGSHGNGSRSRDINGSAPGVDKFLMLESSSVIGSHCQLVHNSPSTFSSEESPTPTSQLHSRLHRLEQLGLLEVEDPQSGDDLSAKLRELETIMLGSNPDMLELYDANAAVEAQRWEELMGTISRGEAGLKSVLFACAKVVEANDSVRVDWLVSKLKTMVSVSGEPVQRVGAYMLEGLIAKLASSGSSIYRALRCRESVAGPNLLSYMHLLYETCPYFKFGYLSANGAIADAMKHEDCIHIIDFQIAQGSQWISLIQAFGTRPGGSPRIRITGIDDSASASAYASGGGLEIVRQRLSQIAESCNVPFEFHAAAVPASEVEFEHLGVRPGEAIAVNFPLMLHHIPDESVCPKNQRDRLIRLSKSLSPKVVTLIEQESNTNTAPFYSRFMEAFDYYSSVFESIDVKLPRDNRERIKVEQHCLARDIVNLIACEELERVERHEPLRKWRLRFTMAGFHPYPLSSLVNSTIRGLLRGYNEKYMLEERDEALLLGWKNRPLVFSCAWA